MLAMPKGEMGVEYVHDTNLALFDLEDGIQKFGTTLR